MTFKEWYDDGNYVIYGLDSSAIHFPDEGITSLEGIEQMENLKFIQCDHNSLTSLKGIENLKKLKTIHCSHNNIKTLEGIENLENLKDLDISNNPVFKYFKNITDTSEIIKIVKSKQREKIINSIL